MIGRPIGELSVGQTAELTRTVTRQMISDFAGTVGDHNPLHADPAFARSVKFEEPIAPGVLTAGLISAAIGTLLPGPGTLYLSQELKFRRPVYPGDTITARVEVTELMPQRNRVKLSTVCLNQDGEDVLVGEAWVKPPKQRVEYAETPVDEAGVPTAMTMATSALQLWTGLAHATLSYWQPPDGRPTNGEPSAT
ncbi:MAG: MaoC family dehydratase [Acidimicrobiia bacterium]|nr:MaoC family dehydratase [Acidimicrobiia bacterium]